MPSLVPSARIVASLAAVLLLPIAALAQAVLPGGNAQVPALTPVAKLVGAFHEGWATIDGDGKLVGRVVTLSANGELVPQDQVEVRIDGMGGPIAAVTTDAEGAFELTGLRPGVYLLEAEGSGAYAAFSFQAVPSDSVRPMDVYAAGMQPARVRDVFRELWSPSKGKAKPAYGEVRPDGWPVEQSPYVVAVDGMLRGQLAFPFSVTDYTGCVVKAYQDGELVASAPVDGLARFELRLPRPGVTDLVVGGAGLSACISAVVQFGGGATAAVTESGGQFVAKRLLQDSLLVPVRPAPGVAPEELGATEEAVLPPPPVAGMAGGAPIGGGGFGGAGGGGIGGASGLGGLLGAAGLAVGVAALSDDDGFDGNLATGIGP
ncbi:MAG: hypothetical protein KatS3mg111_3125 [Pirellulaceae bacterium]|nr:MAG: hypothetical protein KatS3mg111_3125 [Pirellulaceae bacterium]